MAALLLLMEAQEKEPRHKRPPAVILSTGPLTSVETGDDAPRHSSSSRPCRQPARGSSETQPGHPGLRAGTARSGREIGDGEEDIRRALDVHRPRVVSEK